LVFEKNAIFFAEKLAKITENCDHNIIDPGQMSNFAAAHLSNQCYGICIRRETSMCYICYIPTISNLYTDPAPVIYNFTDTTLDTEPAMYGHTLLS
jgi:hypothetical protein